MLIFISNLKKFRVRPSSERERGLSNIIRVVDDRLLLFDPPGARDAHRKGGMDVSISTEELIL